MTTRHRSARQPRSGYAKMGSLNEAETFAPGFPRCEVACRKAECKAVGLLEYAT